MRIRKRPKLKTVIGFLLAAAVLFLGPAGGVLFAQNPDPADWPMWPEPSKQIYSLSNPLPVYEPATFLSIGREVVPWVFFGSTNAANKNIKIVGSELVFTIEQYSLEYDDNEWVKKLSGYVFLSPTSRVSDPLFIVSNGAIALFDELYNELFVPNLQENSVFPVLKDKWFFYGTPPNFVDVANESLLADKETDPGKYITNWKDFLSKNLNIDNEYFFADSGHAPPQMIWPFDPWLYSYRAKTGYTDPPSAWEDRYACMWPTNQGALQVFEINNVGIPDTNPSVYRSWMAVPSPSLKQSIYHELRKAYSNDYWRLTLLDGPVTVRDVEIDGQWRRIAIGTTGMGTKQVPKPQNAWTELGQSVVNPSGIPSQTEEEKGRVFGVYAFDITDIDHPLGVDQSPTPLWSVTNINFETSAITPLNKCLLETPSGIIEIDQSNADYGAFSKMDFSVSKPLIGYTRDANNNRKWHVIILGTEKDTKKYFWLDLSPENGKVLDSGYFFNTQTSSEEKLRKVYAKKGEKPKDLLFVEEELENLNPSRILSAFPPKKSLYKEPLLSDVYVYLSNGSLYQWDINESKSNSNPQFIAAFINNDGQPASPITDFDITYSSDGGTYDTYLAANVALTYNGASDHETEGLIIANLSKVSSNQSSFTPPGQDGERIQVTNTRGDIVLEVVQLQGEHGSYSPKSKTVLASPVFVGHRVYLSFYEMEGKKNKFNATRLYVIEFLKNRSGNAKLSKASKLDDMGVGKAGEYFDFEEREATMMFIDSQGNLTIVFEEPDSQGNITASIETGLELYSGDASGETGEWSGSNLGIVYWKTL